jgi:Reverse transcriptase (RNA-dependent DNA polymerase)/Integrase core domain/GAG-pre-integrase domain
VALLTNTNSNSKSGKSTAGKKLTLKCKHCDRKGHIEADCWTKYPDKRPERKEKNGSKKSEAKYAMSAHRISSQPTKADESYWYLDSGASEHFSPFKDLFTEFKELDKPCEIITAEGTSVKGIGIGTIMINAIGAEDAINTLSLHNVIYAPKMDANLLSVSTLYDKGYEVSIKPGNGTRVLFDSNVIAETVREGRLWRLLTVPSTAVAKAAIGKEEMDVWHRRMGHLGEANVRKLAGMVEGMSVDMQTTVGVCQSCLEGKQTRTVSHEPRKRATEPLELIHSDTTGQITPTSLGGANYAGTFTDDFTGMTFIVPMKGKSAAELLERFKEFKEEAENQLGRKIKRLRTDGGGEYKKAFGKYLRESGIIHETTAPYSPEQNGVSERANRTILERVKAILADTGLPKELWMELASTIVYLKNRSPSRSLPGSTPYEMWYNERPELSHLRIIGSNAHVLIPKEKRRKLDFHSQKGILVGYGGTHQYRVYIPEKEDVVISRDVVIDEMNLQGDMAIVIHDEPRPEQIIHDEIIVQPLPRRQSIQSVQERSTSMEPEIQDEPDDDNSNEELPTTEKEVPRKSTRSNKGQFTQERFGDIEWATGKSSARVARTDKSTGEPQTFDEAIDHPEYSRQWEEAILDEYNSLVKNSTWILTELPEGRKAISCKWVFKHKTDEEGNVTRFKARLVARGYTQISGVDYLDTFAPVAKLSSIKILFSIAAAEDLEIHQMDVVTAFLLEDLDDEIYMEQPEGLEKTRNGKGKGNLVCKLRKGLYGLKQSARNWNRKLRRELEVLGFQQCQADHCIFVNQRTGIILAVWVDDIIILGKEMEEINEIKRDLNEKFEMKDLGELEYFLGIQLFRDRATRRIHINQTGYINTILERFGMTECKPASTPMASGTKLLKSDGENMVNQHQYQSMVGSQMYGMLSTRPDIAYLLSQISQFSSAPNATHESAAKRGLRYLSATKDIGITYDGHKGLEMKAYSDADYATGEDRKSISGMVITLGGGAVSYQSKKQSTVATSTTEAEYMAVANAVKEVIWIQLLLKELGRYGHVDGQDMLYSDNQAAIALAHNPEYHARTKHIDVQYHFIRECIENKVIKLEYCPTKEMVADAMTKALPRDRHWILMGEMGLESLQQFRSGSDEIPELCDDE